jgi:hypothetical protein
VNKNLYNRKAKLPESLMKHLEDSFKGIEGDSNLEGFNRNQELRDKGFATYQQIKRIKNWFNSYNGNKEDAPFILNGGDRMNRWCDSVLNHWRTSDKLGKQVKSDTGMQNQFIDDHSKDGFNITPGSKHETGINKYDTAVTEEIKKINKLMI